MSEKSKTLLNPDAFYQVKDWNGIAWTYRGDETEETEDTWWDGIEEPTGNVIMVMVGDDAQFVFDPSDCKELPEDEFCHGCGQIGCGH